MPLHKASREMRVLLELIGRALWIAVRRVLELLEVAVFSWHALWKCEAMMIRLWTAPAAYSTALSLHRNSDTVRSVICLHSINLNFNIN
jgi:hypothetical protein